VYIIHYENLCTYEKIGIEIEFSHILYPALLIDISTAGLQEQWQRRAIALYLDICWWHPTVVRQAYPSPG